MKARTNAPMTIILGTISNFFLVTVLKKYPTTVVHLFVFAIFFCEKCGVRVRLGLGLGLRTFSGVTLTPRTNTNECEQLSCCCMWKYRPYLYILHYLSLHLWSVMSSCQPTTKNVLIVFAKVRQLNEIVETPTLHLFM